MDGTGGREVEAQLRAALAARADAAVGAHAVAPAPRFAALDSAAQAAPDTSGTTRPAPRRWVRWAAPLAAAAAVVGVVAGLGAVGHRSTPATDTAAGTRRPHSSAAASTPATTVHVKLLNDDGATYGVGMPVIAYFSRAITDARPLQQATTASVDGRPAQGAWYFEKSAAGNGPIEAHFRLAQYWPANADVVVSLAIKGRSAGGGLTYDDDLTTEFHTGAKTVVAVNGRTHRLTLSSGAATVGAFPVALGPTTRPGTAVVMNKPGDVTLTVKGVATRAHYAARITYGGEFLLAAPWNRADIENGVDSSNGSAELRTADAKALFGRLRIGDIVTVTGTSGPPLTIGAGFGDWNLTWTQWLTGGLVRTH